MPTSESLERFVCVVETGNFSAAARVLGVSRQAVQRSIDLLEEHYSVALFERSTRRLRLTDAGRRLLPAAQAVSDALKRAQNILKTASDTPHGTLRITSSALFAECVLSPLISSFLSKWPKVRVEAFFTAKRTNAFDADVDLTFQVGMSPPEYAQSVWLGQASFVLVASEAYLESAEPIRHPRDLSRHATLGYGGKNVKEWVFTDGDEVVACPVHPRVFSNDAHVALNACKDGLGVLRLPWLAIAQGCVPMDRVVRVLPRWCSQPRDIWAVYGSEATRSPTLQAFLDHIRDYEKHLEELLPRGGAVSQGD